MQYDWLSQKQLRILLNSTHIMLSLTRHASADWLTPCDVMPARRMRIQLDC